MKNYAQALVNIIFNNIRIIALLLLFLVTFGTATFVSIERQGFPEVTVNFAMITAPYPTATAQQVEEDVIKPIESAIKTIEEIESYETVSQDNFGVATITIDAKADTNEIITKITNEIATVDFPEGVETPKVNKFDVAGIGDFMLGVTSQSDAWDLYLETNIVKEAIESLDGVKSVKILNPLTPEIAVIFNQDKLKEKGLKRTEIEETLKLIEFEAPAGSYNNAEDQQVNISIAGKVDTIQLLRAFQITEDTQLQDVAEVKVELNNHEKYNRIGFRDSEDELEPMQIKRAVVLSVNSDKDGDILDIDEQITKKIESIKADKKIAEQTTVVDLYSMADSTRKQIDEIKSSLIGNNIEDYDSFGFVGYAFGGLTLVVLLLFIFMNARVAIMAALAIPLSLFTATIYLSYLDIGLNTLVLFSMILAIGLVVDPTIVFLESMQRYKEQGYSGKESAARTVSTVGLGITLAVATNILVFVPFSVVSGFFGEIIKYIPATIIPAMLASLIIPVLFFMPIAAKLLKPKKEIEKTEDPELIGTWKLSQKLGELITWTLKKGPKFAALRVALIIFAIILPFALGGVMLDSGAVEVVQFSTPEDADAIFIIGDIKPEIPFEEAVANIIVPMQDLIKEQPEIRDFSYIQQEDNSFFLLMNLINMDLREKEGLRKANDLARELNSDIDKLELDADIFAAADGGGPSTGQEKIKVQIKNEDKKVLAVASQDIKNFMSSLEGVEKVEDNLETKNGGGSITLELKNGNKFTKNPLLAYSIVKDRIAKNDLGKVIFDNQEFDLKTRTKTPPTSIDEIKNLEVFKAPENLPPGVEMKDVQIKDIIGETVTKEPESIRRIDGRAYAEVSGLITEDANAIDLQDKLESYLTDEKLEQLNIDPDAVSYKGEADSIAESFTDLFISLAIAIFLIYILLVAFFRSYIEPFIILFAIPLGMVGVFAAVALTSGQLGFLELLGVVAMAGIVVNVTILLIDSANQQVRQGKTPAKAMSTAVAVRFRPIVLTQMTAFGSLVPLVIISPFWKGLAASIILGIISSALLSLFVTPILYVWSYKIGKWPRKIARATKNIDKTMAAIKEILTVKEETKA